MTSKRFPGKVVAMLGGKPVLQRVIECVRDIKGLDDIIVASPAMEESEPIIKICGDLNVKLFLGDEEDVLNRYYHCAMSNKLDVIMRVTGDCPLLCSDLCSHMLEEHLSEGYEYTSNCHPSRSWPRGFDCEIFNFDVLEAAHSHTIVPYDREHVTPFMQRNEGVPRKFKLSLCALSEPPRGIDQSNVNMCVDYPEDIGRLEGMLRYKDMYFKEGVGRE